MIYFYLFLSLIICFAVSLVLNVQNKKKQPVEMGFYSEGRMIPVKTSIRFMLASAINKITGNKIANGTQKDGELQFKRITETVPAGIFTTDAFGAVNYVNPRWCEIIQISFNEAMGDGWLKAVHPEDRENLVLAWRQATSANSSLKTEYRVLCPDGSVVWVIGQAVPLKGEAGNFGGYAGTLKDITECKKTEEELIAKKAKAEESDRLKTAFLNNLNHETRTPLNAIVGFSNLLRDSDITAEDKEEYLKIIEESSIQLLHIINDIIDISIIESGQIKISLSEINIEDQIQFIYERFDE
jgi:PAS domain S-box-containing protein